MRGAKLCGIGVGENAMQQPLKNFSQKKIESLELTLDERNRQAIYRKSEPVLMEKDKIVLVVNRHISSADDEEETAEIAVKRQ
jgi:adenylate cyclase